MPQLLSIVVQAADDDDGGGAPWGVRRDSGGAKSLMVMSFSAGLWSRERIGIIGVPTYRDGRLFGVDGDV